MKLENLTLLYVEDEKELRDLMTSILQDQVSTLYTAKDGLEAYNVYKEKSPDIILSDINMPLLSGIDFIKKVRQNDQKTKVIMLTAYSDVDNLLQATELKLTKYLVKPFDGFELLSALQLAVDEINNYNIISIKSLELGENYHWDFKEQELTLNDQVIRLTPKEKKILNILFSNLNATITYDTLLMDVWDDYEHYSIDTLKTMMKNIRKKLPKDLIQNVYATGYKVIL